MYQVTCHHLEQLYKELTPADLAAQGDGLINMSKTTEVLKLNITDLQSTKESIEKIEVMVNNLPSLFLAASMTSPVDLTRQSRIIPFTIRLY
ncbi:hypothetical protein JD844_003015 [Phrynosoma platyrhinos]|uniref:Uncharacterized protein n=1 Tax=Phrynosoma platyrhinos TaxID=52577 RepID=A0ABQ7TCD7_PHRPL|nr:hypothetical protein JD844_003015 [Phrynosoma platyrhinos]